MNTIKIKDGTWHHFLATSTGGFSRHSHRDICAYTRCVLWGLFMWTLIVSICAVIFAGAIVGPINALCWYLFDANIGGQKWANFGTGMFGAELFGGACVGIAFLWERWKAKKRRREWEIEEGRIPAPPPKPPSFIKEAYAAWKGKYCARVEIV